MSRWLDTYNSHAFRSAWDNLKTELDNLTIDDESVFPEVQELARLKKVISYVDGMIIGLDAEIVPISTWDNVNTYATSCQQEIQHYKNNKNIAYLQNANSHADNLLTYIRPYMVVGKNIDSALQSAIKSYAKTIEEYGESFRIKSSDLLLKTKDFNEQSQALFEQIEATDTLIKDFNNQLFGGDTPTNSIKNKVDELANDFERKHETISDYYNEVLIGDGDAISTKKAITQAKDSILAEKQKIEALLVTVETHVDDLTKFHHKIFGKLNENNELDDGLKAELDKRTKQLKDFEDIQQIKYNALIDKIESLMPGATSAGLATAYHDLKESFKEPIREASNLFFWSIGIIVLIAGFSTIESFGIKEIESIKDGVVIHSSGMPYVNFAKLTDLDTILKGLISKIPFYAPVLWLAFYASKRRSEFYRLQQEYAHKEALSKSYDKYKKQIDDLKDKDPELQKLLITSAINAIAYNASNTLDRKHGDKMPAYDLVEKVVESLKKSKDS